MPGKINNGVSIGARKKKVSKRRPKRGLRSYVKAVAKYLVSDTYMYAPLVEEAAVDGDRYSSSSSLSPDGIARSPLDTGLKLPEHFLQYLLHALTCICKASSTLLPPDEEVHDDHGCFLYLLHGTSVLPVCYIDWWSGRPVWTWSAGL